MSFLIPRWVRTSETELEESERLMLEPVSSPYTVKTVPVGDAGEYMSCAVFSESCPAGAPWLLIGHGYGSGLGFFAKNVDYFASRYRLVLFEWLGWGRSARPPFRGSGSQEAEAFFVNALDRFVRYLEIDKFFLAGHSMGGYLATCYALDQERQAKLLGLLLVSPVGIPEKPEGWTGPKVGHHWKPLIWLAETFSLTAMSFIRASGPLGPGLVAKFRHAMAERFQGFYANHLHVVNGYSYHLNAQAPSGETAMNEILHFAYARDPLINRLDGLGDLPVVLLYGESDWMDVAAGRRMAEILRTRSKFVDLHIVPDAGHNLFADNPDEFNKMCEDGLLAMKKVNQ
jgi:pimeloyl-ACP methyl ester carboxylesterase